MALNIKFRIEQSGDCKTFKIFDSTGTYNASTNPGGYGTPNPAATDFDGSGDYFKFIITNPEGIISTIGPYAGNASPTFSNSLLFSTGFSIGVSKNGGVSDLSGLQAGTALPDGNWIIQYILYNSAGPTTYTVTKQYFFTCNMDCKMSSMLSELAKDYCVNNKCDQRQIDAYMEYYLYHSAMQDAARCGNVNGAKKLYALLAKKLNIDCGCNCS